MRFSVKGMLAAVTAVALGCAALLNANAVWAGAVYAVAFLGLCMAVLGIVYRRGRSQAFWTGFAIFGLAYTLLIGANPVGQQARRTPMDGVLGWCHEKVARDEPLPPPAPMSRIDAARRAIEQMQRANSTKSSEADLKRVGHPLLLLLFAYVGGWLGYAFHATNKRDP